MPRGDFNVHFASRGRGSYIRAEEAAGIALLAIILTALLILGCWYYRRRSGYKMIRNSRGTSQSWRDIMRSGQYSEPGAAAENKVALNEFSNLQPALPNAPPAYEKIASGPLPPPYSPWGTSLGLLGGWYWPRSILQVESRMLKKPGTNPLLLGLASTSVHCCAFWIILC